MMLRTMGLIKAIVDIPLPMIAQKIQVNTPETVSAILGVLACLTIKVWKLSSTPTSSVSASTTKIRAIKTKTSIRLRVPEANRPSAAKMLATSE